MGTSSSFYADGEVYDEGTVVDNDHPSSGTTSTSPSSFYPQGNIYDALSEESPVVAEMTALKVATEAAAASGATSASTASSYAAVAVAAASTASAAVQSAAGTATPLVDGTAAVGTGTKWAREDHKHPTDTSRAAKGANSDITSLTGMTTPLSAAQGGTGNAGGAWTSYTPVVSAQTGTITTATASGAYRQIGKTVFFRLQITVTNNGTGATSVVATLPAAALPIGNIFAFVGRANAISGKLLIAAVGGVGFTNVFMTNYDATYPAVNGEQLIVSGSYEAA